jgi:hypothetical protein
VSCNSNTPCCLDAVEMFENHCFMGVCAPCIPDSTNCLSTVRNILCCCSSTSRCLPKPSDLWLKYKKKILFN